MEKKGEILNQLAIISDLLEKANIDSQKIKVDITLSPMEFKKMYGIITKMTNFTSLEVPSTYFMVQIGNVEFTFIVSMSNA